MITTPDVLKKFCDTVSKFQIGKPWPAPISSRMYQKLTKWQYSNKYPQLLSLRLKSGHHIVRVI